MSNTTVKPYLFFGGRCEEALEFYRTALGAEINAVMRFRDSPEPLPPGMVPPGFENKVMHACFHVGGSNVMASDGCNPGSGFAGFSLALSVATDAQAERAFVALTDGGHVKMPLAKTFWSSSYGMVTDRFGISWMVMVAADTPA